MVETPSRVAEGPDAALEATATAMELALAVAGVARSHVLAVGLDTPGPASATGVISSKGGNNFPQPPWWGFDVRAAVEAAARAARDLQQRRQRRRPVRPSPPTSAARPAHGRRCRPSSAPASVAESSSAATLSGARPGWRASSVTCTSRWTACSSHGQPDAEVQLRVRRGPRERRLAEWHRAQPAPLLAGPVSRSSADRRRCGSMADAARAVRGFGERGDEMAMRIFAQQATAIGRMFTIAANFTDPDAYFVGGGVIEADPDFRDWFLAVVRESTTAARRAGAASPVRGRRRPRHGRRRAARRSPRCRPSGQVGRWPSERIALPTPRMEQTGPELATHPAE